MEHNSQDQKVRTLPVIGIRNGVACVLKHTPPKVLRSKRRKPPKKSEYADIQIEHGIPIPQKRTAGHKMVYYVNIVRQMYIGDSFYMEGVSSVRVSTMMKYWKQATGFKFAIREIDNGTRVWRIK